MRLIEVRMLEGPNLFRLEPAVKIEVAIEDAAAGSDRARDGARTGRAGGRRLGRAIAGANRPPELGPLVEWLRILRGRFGEGRGGILVHRGSDPGHWIVTAPWRGLERARSIAEAAWDLATARPDDLAAALERHTRRIHVARTTPPELLRDSERQIPIVSISGTNGKSTVTRLITHILLLAGRHVGTTTSDGVLVDERLIDAGDWTGPGGAHLVLGRSDVEVAVLETARGGILLRGVGYESNDASVITNISADHLDLQGIHTLAELLEVKSVICRITRPEGWVVLNADDALVAGVASRVRASVAFFSLTDGVTGASPLLRTHLAAGGRAYLVRRGRLVEVEGDEVRPIAPITDIPITIGGIARHNVENALAAAGGARAMGATIEEVADGVRDFAPSPEASPGRLNLFRVGGRIVIVDFAHNEAGIAAVLAVAEGIAAGGAGRAAPITAIIGTAGDRPDDTLRGIARIAAKRAQRVAVKETLKYLRGRSRESIVGELLAGVKEAGMATSDVPIYESETAALKAELADSGARPRVVVLLCHEEREEVFELLESLGARPIDVATELASLVPRFEERPRRH